MSAAFRQIWSTLSMQIPPFFDKTNGLCVVFFMSTLSHNSNSSIKLWFKFNRTLSTQIHKLGGYMQSLSQTCININDINWHEKKNKSARTQSKRSLIVYRKCLWRLCASMCSIKYWFCWRGLVFNWCTAQQYMNGDFVIIFVYGNSRTARIYINAYMASVI